MARPVVTMRRIYGVAVSGLMLNVPISHAVSPADQENGVIGNCTETASSSSPLAITRRLNAPLASVTEGAEFEHAAFWEEHGPLLRDAWEEWEEQMMESSVPLSSGRGDSNSNERGGEDFITPNLSTALRHAFDKPSEETEAAVKALWTNSSDALQTVPKGVYAIQLLTESGISRIRNLLDAATSSGIPTRRPNGMNRQGVIVDPDVDGAVSMKSLVNLVEEHLIRRVVRPSGRVLFPDRVGCDDDLEYFAFTIRYDGVDGDDGEKKSENDVGADGNVSNRDFELKEHRDASIVTLNINLNLPHEGYAGSEVYFREFPSDECATKEHNDECDRLPQDNHNDGGTVRFSPGMAIVHLGAHRHGALPISESTNKIGSGKRYNLIIWLFGKDGDVRISPYEKKDQMDVIQRLRGCDFTRSISFD